MKFERLKSWAKINLSLNVIKKLRNNYHSIESLISFIGIFDEVKIRKINSNNNKIIFLGKFSKGISKKNTISKLLNLLEKKGLLKNSKFEIKITKNIPQRSGMGGGSMNAACIIKYLIEKKIIKISNVEAQNLAYEVGSDVALGLEKKNSILFKNKKIVRVKKKLNLYVLIVKPNFGCSTKKIFNKVKRYSKPLYFNKNEGFFNTKYLTLSKNTLEDIAFIQYPRIKNLKYFLLKLPNVIFTRMTGTGSAVVAYFKSKDNAVKAAKIFKGKYKGYWCIVSKTI